MDETLTIYYQNIPFADWVKSRKFVGVTQDNVSKYFSVYQRYDMCQKSQCHDCVGLVPDWSSEEEIQTGLFKQVKCEKKKQQLLINFKNKIPPIYKDADYTKYNDDVKRAVEIFINGFPKTNGLYIYSVKHNIGKTTLVWSIINKLLQEKKFTSDFIYNNTVDMAMELHEDAFENNHTLYKEYKNCSLLVIDDFGDYNMTQATLAKIRSILDFRHAQKVLPVIIVGSTPSDQWAFEKSPLESTMLKILKMTETISL
jgi:DNA replication protein DnaC